jgi:hypothetical protein
VAKDDSQVQRLLATREDVFAGYGQAGFEAAFFRHYELVESQPISGTSRTLYLLRRRG